MSTDVYAKSVSYYLVERPIDAVAWQCKCDGQLKPEWLERLEHVGRVVRMGAPIPPLATPMGNTPIIYQLTDWVVLTAAGEVNVLPDFFFAKRYTHLRGGEV